jgi:hypothetical protein
MGWLFTMGYTKQRLVAERVKTQENESARWEYPKHRLVGSCLWKVCIKTDRETGMKESYICLDLIKSQKNYGYGYKDMDESMGPCYYTCPLSFFAIVPCPDDNSNAAEWRQAVRQYHAEVQAQKLRHAAIKPGETYSLIKSKIPFVIITRKEGKKIIGSYMGAAYRIPLKMIGELKTVNA